MAVPTIRAKMRSKSQCRRAKGMSAGIESTCLRTPPKVHQGLLASAAEQFKDLGGDKLPANASLMATPRVGVFGKLLSKPEH